MCFVGVILRNFLHWFMANVLQRKCVFTEITILFGDQIPYLSTICGEFLKEMNVKVPDHDRW